MSQDLKILLVEDDDDFRKQTVRSLLPFNEVTEASSLRQAREAIAKSSFDVAILDKSLPDGESGEIVQEIATNHPNCAIIVLTGDADQALVHRYMNLGVHDYVQKTENAVLDLRIRIPAALATIALQRKSQALEERVSSTFRHEIVGKSEATRKLRERVLSLKGNRFPVLITGESGTGKESVAQMLHKIEGSSRRPFVTVNCGAIPENLVESELFGHCRGAFTGAVRNQIGKFDLAHQGDIFLDEIGDLPLAAQVKLLRVLQEGEFYRVGETSIRRVSVRIIAATNRDLTQLVREGRFREDLYYRINVIPIQTTPLRDRLEDIPDIVRFVLAVVGKGRYQITEDALVLLARPTWKGNVRELVNVVDRATIEANIRSSIVLESRDFSFLTEAPSKSIDGRPSLPKQRSEISLKALDEYVQQAEKEFLAQALNLYDGNVTELAQQIGYSRSALFRRVANAGLNGTRAGLTTTNSQGEAGSGKATHR
jgi:DNA-binding NtrC family response regulator